MQYCPEYLKYFDYAKNKGIDPMKLLIGKPVFWRCNKAKDHRWKMGFWKTHVTEACPFCRGYKASSTNNLKLEKSLMRDFDAKLNPGIKPKEVPLGSATVLKWKYKNALISGKQKFLIVIRVSMAAANAHKQSAGKSTTLSTIYQ